MQSIATEQIPVTIADYIKPSKVFQQQVYRSMWALSAFFLTYILLLKLAVGLAIAFGAFGVFIIAAYTHWITIALGLSLFASGILLVYFLIKFVFKKHSDDVQHYEITETEQPRLFAFIREVTDKTGTPFPKHVYLIPDVNASVFYDATFLSMFLPVKKNLNIGLGLVNCINQGEFRSVLAHEFGHFSQRSMKFGSYVYHVNIMINNMLYDNESYGNILDKWGSIHSFFRLTAWINVKIIQAIQFVLRKMHVYINKTQLSLSRQMEFHADAIAACAAGANNTITSSRRIDIGQICYNDILEYWNRRIPDKTRAVNFYPQHLEFIKHYADSFNIPMDADGLPHAASPIPELEPREVIIGSEWSTHPTSKEREEALLTIPFHREPESDAAWALFNNAEEIQQQFTRQLYENVENSHTFTEVSFHEFRDSYDANLVDSNFSTIYKGYYNSREVSEFDADQVIASINSYPFDTLDALLTNENCRLFRTITYAENDMAVLDSLMDTTTNTDVKYFQFRNKDYPVTEARTIKEVLEKEVAQKRLRLIELDTHLFVLFYRSAKSDVQKRKLTDYYNLLFTFPHHDNASFPVYAAVNTALAPLYETMPFDKIKVAVNHLKGTQQPLKDKLIEIKNDESFAPYIDAELTEAISKYLDSTPEYFKNNRYDNDELDLLIKVNSGYFHVFTERTFRLKKEMFDYQLSLLN